MNAPPAAVYEFGEFHLDLEKRLLCRDGDPVPLTSRVFETLVFLVTNHGRLLEKEHLMDAVWPDCIVEENNLTQNISTLRRVFGEKPGTHRFIVTVPGRGYRFVADVHAAREPADVLTADIIDAGVPVVAVTGEASPAPVARAHFFRAFAIGLLIVAVVGI